MHYILNYLRLHGKVVLGDVCATSVQRVSKIAYLYHLTKHTLIAVKQNVDNSMKITHLGFKWLCSMYPSISRTSLVFCSSSDLIWSARKVNVAMRDSATARLSHCTRQVSSLFCNYVNKIKKRN